MHASIGDNYTQYGIYSLAFVIVRPLSTVEYTSVASVFHSRPWSD